jgi:hypothetical protein
VEVRRGAGGQLASVLERCLERVRVDEVGARVAAGHVVADEPARRQPAAGERLVEAGHRLEPQVLADGEQVERDLELQLVAPLHAADDVAALVVAHDRLAVRTGVDAVDASRDEAALPAQRQRPVGVLCAAERPLELRRLVAGAALGLRS